MRSGADGSGSSSAPPALQALDLQARTLQAAANHAARLAVLRPTHKRSSGNSLSNGARRPLHNRSQSDAQEGNDDFPSDDDQPGPGTHHAASHHSSGSYSDTLRQVETDRMYNNGRHLLSAQDAVPCWLEEAAISEQQKRESMGRYISRWKQTATHECVHGTSSTPTPVVSTRTVMYMSLEHCFAMDVPQLHCPACLQHFDMPPVVARCFGNSAVEPSVYTDLGLLTLFHHLKMVSGMGDTLMCNAWNEVRQYSWLHGLDSHRSQRMVPSQLGDTYRWWRNMFRNFGRPEGLLEAEYFPGAFGKCPVCSDPHPTTLHDLNPPATPGWSQFESALVAALSAQQQKAERAAASLAQGTASPVPVASSQQDATGAEGPAMAIDPDSAAALAQQNAVTTAGTAVLGSVAVGTVASSSECSTSASGADLMEEDMLVASHPAVPVGPVLLGSEVVQNSGSRWVVPGRTSGSLQRPLLRRRTYATADGGQKLTHYAKCGMSHTAVCKQMNAAPMHSRYFAANLPNVYAGMTQHVKDLAKTKAQAAAAVAAAAAAAAATAAATAQAAAGDSSMSRTPLLDQLLLSEQFETLCQADLLAARAVAPSSKSAYTDVKVVLGCVCPHAVPGRDMFISCPDPECFAGFDAIFVPKLLSKDAPKLDAIIIDVGCRYEAHFKYHHEVVSAQVPHVFVGWLHSNAGHNLSCQLKFCGMYHEGMGRCIGEQTEQLWAFMKPHAKITRYMSLPRRSEYLDDLLEFFADLKYENIPELTCQTLVITLKQERQLTEDVDKLLSSPEGSSLQRGQKYEHRPTTSAPTDRLIQYVQTLMELELQVSRQSSGRRDLAAMMQQPSGAHLTKASSKEGLNQTEAKLQTLERHLKIKIRWKPEDREYQEHFARLCAMQISTLQLSIEKEVSVMVTLRDHRDQMGVSGRETEVLDKRYKVRLQKVRELLVMLAAWSEQAGIPDMVLCEEDVLHNNLPWQTGGEYKNCSLDFLRLKLYKMECELQRCAEELSYLPSDAVKVMLYFGRQIRLLQCWLMKQHTIGSAPSGLVILMFDRMRKVERLYDDASAKFLECGLLQP